MSVPDLVRQRLDDEPVEASVALGDDDVLVVTPSRTMLYRGEGLIRDASVEEHAHDAESVSLSEGRRKSTIGLERGLDDDSEISVPADRLEDILPAVLRGVLRTADVLGPDESVRDVFRLGELTLIVCEDRLLKHVGNGLWDEQAEGFAFEDVTGLDVEEGEVSSQIIVELGGRPERIKVPTDDARGIRERIEDALLAHHEVENYNAFVRLQGTGADTDTAEPEADSVDDSESTSEADTGDGGIEFGGAVDGGAGETIGLQSGAETDAAEDDHDVAEEVAALRETVERQNELLEAHERTIQQLIEELRER